MKPIYQEVIPGVTCNLSIATLIEAATRLGPSFAYDICCSPRERLWVQSFMKDLGCNTRNNPFSPYVNVIPCETFSGPEWCLTLAGQSEGYGSKGI